MEVDQPSNQEIFSDMDRIMNRKSYFADDFDGADDLMAMLHDDAQVLVIGAGGLGCEILKDLALSGVKNITVIDLDRIDLTNLNRQFLFRMKDVGRYKAEVAAEVVMNRCPGVKITWHTDFVQTFPADFFAGYQVVIGGLDNIEARRWLNSMIHSLVEWEDGEAQVGTFYIDGGTEGFSGQARVVEPYKDACYDCVLKTLPPETTYALCTVKEIPRQPEHCIQYVMMIEWPENFERSMDKDSPEDMQWVCDRAIIRAEKYNIKGVDYKLTMGVTKNIIPAIASTNALISALCVNECVKLLTGCNYRLKNVSYARGQTSMNISQLEDLRGPECLVCSSTTQTRTVNGQRKLGDFVDDMKEEFKLIDPTIQHHQTSSVLCGTGIYKQNNFKLEFTFDKLIEEGHFKTEWDELLVTDKSVASKISLKIVVVKPE